MKNARGEARRAPLAPLESREEHVVFNELDDSGVSDGSTSLAVRRGLDGLSG